MKITEQDIIKVANLARLELSADDVSNMVEKVGEILNYIDKLNELDTGGVEPTTHAISVSNAFRDDVVQESLAQEKALQNGPLQNGEAFVVPKII